MFLLNFSHRLTAEQVRQIEMMTQQSVSRLLELYVHFDEQQPFAPQLERLLVEIDFTPTEWQNEAILLLLPSLNWIASMLLAALHGRMGFFPSVVRLRSIENEIPLTSAAPLLILVDHAILRIRQLPG